MNGHVSSLANPKQKNFMDRKDTTLFTRQQKVVESECGLGKERNDK